MDREYAALYAEANISEYWIVLAEAKQVEVRWQPVNGSYTELNTFGPGGSMISQSLPWLSLSLDELFS